MKILKIILIIIVTVAVVAVTAATSTSTIGIEKTFISGLSQTIFLTITLLILLHLYLENRHIAKLGNKIPGDKPLPFIGNILDINGLQNDRLVKSFIEKTEKNKGILRVWFGPYLTVFLGNHLDVEIILNSQEHIDKSDEYRFFKPWLGDGLLISTGDKWRRHRKLIAPAFHHNILKGFINIFNENSIAVCNEMIKEIGKYEFDVHHYMNCVTVDILLDPVRLSILNSQNCSFTLKLAKLSATYLPANDCCSDYAVKYTNLNSLVLISCQETAMGTKKIKNESFKYGRAVLDLCELLHIRQKSLHLRPSFMYNISSLKRQEERVLKIVHSLSRNVFKIKKKEAMQNEASTDKQNTLKTVTEIINMSKQDNPFENHSVNEFKLQGDRDDLDEQDENDIGEKKRLPFLDLLIEISRNGGDITDQEVIEQVDTIMFEGHDTTSAGSSFFLCLLGLYDDVQDKCYNELYKIFGDSDRPATINDVNEMKYLERCILETLRIYPPVPLIARKLNRDVKIVTNNLTLPANTTVVLFQYFIHRNPKVFPDPEKFDPDRFLPENSQSRHFYSFIPFSAGPRSCVGRKYAMLKLKILLSTILRRYKIKSSVPQEEFKLRGDIILKRDDGFRIRIQPRENL